MISLVKHRPQIPCKPRARLPAIISNSMSVDVMFPAYSGYYPYGRFTYNDAKKFTLPTMFEPIPDTRHSSPATQTSPVLRGQGGYEAVTKTESDDTEKDIQPKDTQYVNPNCVLLTYFTGDISTVVDEHFTRALSLPSSYSASDSTSTRTSPTWKDASPMSQRNFPPSFWNSNSPTTSSGLPLPPDPYMAAPALHGLHDWGHWTSQTHAYTSRAMHDTLSHYPSMMSSSRLGSHYSSLLMQPGSVPSTSRLPHSMTSQSDLPKSHTETPWASRYHNAAEFMTPKLDAASTALKRLDSNVGESGKDLYWF